MTMYRSSGEALWYTTVSDPDTTEVAGSREASMEYRAVLVQYAGPGMPVVVRVPASMAFWSLGPGMTG